MYFFSNILQNEIYNFFSLKCRLKEISKCKRTSENMCSDDDEDLLTGEN